MSLLAEGVFSQAVGKEAETGGDRVRGWTRDSGVWARYCPFEQQDVCDFLELRDLTFEDAEFLRRCVPEMEQNYAHNLAPSVKQILDLCLRMPSAVRMHGYIVGANREDERIALDGFSLEGRCWREVYRQVALFPGRESRWFRLAEILGFERVGAMPDEFLVKADRGWCWWD